MSLGLFIGKWALTRELASWMWEFRPLSLACLCVKKSNKDADNAAPGVDNDFLSVSHFSVASVFK